MRNGQGEDELHVAMLGLEMHLTTCYMITRSYLARGV